LARLAALSVPGFGSGFGDMAEVEDKLKDYEIKKEGEAEILLHKKNAVFYNPVQVRSLPFFLFFSPFFFKKKTGVLFYRFLICVSLQSARFEFARSDLL